MTQVTASQQKKFYEEQARLQAEALKEVQNRSIIPSIAPPPNTYTAPSQPGIRANERELFE